MVSAGLATTGTNCLVSAIKTFAVGIGGSSSTSFRVMVAPSLLKRGQRLEEVTARGELVALKLKSRVSTAASQLAHAAVCLAANSLHVDSEEVPGLLSSTALVTLAAFEGVSQVRNACMASQQRVLDECGEALVYIMRRR